MTRWFTTILILALSAPAGAQQYQVAREQFAFAGRQITVHVDVESEGTLRVIRGAPGYVRVSGRADFGVTAAGLTADEHLTLTAAADGPVDYVVSIPERVWVNVRLPDRWSVESMGTQERSRTFSWAASGQHPADPADVWVPEPEATFDPGAMHTALAGDLAPRTIAVPDLTHIRSLTVRVEGATFRVGASRPLALYPGSADYLEIRAGHPPLDIDVVVPEGTRGFTLRLDGQPALAVDGTDLSVLCESSTRQWLPGGQGRVTFVPVDGRIKCDPGDRRH
jgi:hypothetical protein